MPSQQGNHRIAKNKMYKPLASFSKPNPVAVDKRLVQPLKMNISPVTIPLPLPSCDSVLALSTILISTSLGFLINDRIKFLSGTLITLLTAALFSNIGLFGIPVPATHQLYDLCWSKLLPASLAFVLLSAKSEETKLKVPHNRSKRREVVSAVGVPFLIGSIGSIIGCVLSACVLIKCQGLELDGGASRLIGMQPHEAIIAAGCLSASYIGGSVNFFAAANIMKRQMHSLFPLDANIETSNILSAMAAADLVVMALYFGGISSLLTSRRLRKIFPGRDRVEGSITKKMPPKNTDLAIDNIRSQVIRKEHGISILLASFLAWIIVEFSIKFESCTIPGMGCAAVAAFGTGIKSLLDKLSASDIKKVQKERLLRFQADLTKCGPMLSDLCFLSLFSSIGLTANLGEAFSNGLSCFIFASLALFIHIIVIGVGSYAAQMVQSLTKNRFVKKIFPPSLEEVLVASNAAIGGASTAAAFAGNISDDSLSVDRNSLIFAATLYGVIGYASATLIGCTLARFMQRYISVYM